MSWQTAQRAAALQSARPFLSQEGGAVFAFQFLELPRELKVSLGHLQSRGLHLRLETSTAMPRLKIVLTFTCIHQPARSTP